MKYNKTNFSFKCISNFHAYLLGVIYGDGGLTHGRIYISSMDADLLDYISSNFESNVWKKHKERNIFDLSLYSVKLAKELNDLYNIPYGKKSDKLTNPNIDDQYFKYFLLGLIDTDGSFYVSKQQKNRKSKTYILNTLKFELGLNSEYLMKCITEKLSLILNKNIRLTTRIFNNPNHNNNYRIALGHADSLKLGDYLYNDKFEFILDRKYAIYNLFKINGSYISDLETTKVTKNTGKSSKYRGVYWSNHKKKWISTIHINGDKKHIGTFTYEIDAAVAYNDKAIFYLGNNAVLNNL